MKPLKNIMAFSKAALFLVFVFSGLSAYCQNMFYIPGTASSTSTQTIPLWDGTSFGLYNFYNSPLTFDPIPSILSCSSQFTINSALNVNGALNANQALSLISYTPGSTSYMLYSNSSGDLLWNGTNLSNGLMVGGSTGQIAYYTGAAWTGTSALNVSTSGTIGIGTAASSSAMLALLASGPVSSNSTGCIIQNTASGSLGSYTKVGLEVQSTGFLWTGDNIGLYVSAVSGGTNVYDAIFNGGGKVGIGTSSPAEKLDVNGAVYLDDISSPGTSTNRLYSVSGNLLWGGHDISKYALSAGTIGEMLYYDGSTNAWTASNAINIIGGNIGINTTSPGEKMDLNGALVIEDYDPVGGAAPSNTTRRLYCNTDVLGVHNLYWGAMNVSGSILSLNSMFNSLNSAGVSDFVPYFSTGTVGVPFSGGLNNSIMKFNPTYKAFQVFNLPSSITTYPTPVARVEADEQGFGLISYDRTCTQTPGATEFDPPTQTTTYLLSKMRADIHLFPTIVGGNCSSISSPIPQPGLVFTMKDENGEHNDALFIKENGRIGIGTDNPSAQVHIFNDAASAVHDDLSSNNNGELLVGKYNYGSGTQGTVKTFGEDNAFFFASQGWGGTSTAVAGDYFKWFADGSSGAGKAHFNTPVKGDLLVIDGTTGDAGIGISQNTYKLQVDGSFAVSDGTSSHHIYFLVGTDGKAYCTELNVEVGPFPDYVFDKEYKLMNLHDLDTYIQSNHHLPGIPTADEVAKSGMDVGKTTTLLLKKVEELTRYVIELKKENEEMKKEISTIRK